MVLQSATSVSATLLQSVTVHGCFVVSEQVWKRDNVKNVLLQVVRQFYTADGSTSQKHFPRPAPAWAPADLSVGKGELPTENPPSTKPAGGEATVGRSQVRFGVLSDACLTPEMKSFIETFRARRIALGYTQEDVGNELSRTNGPSYSQSFISRFESKNLGLRAAEKMKPVMQAWIEQKEMECAKGLRVCKKRKRRTSFSPQCLAVLTAHFEHDPKPSSADIAQIADKLGLEPVTVRVWFCNRKQMYKRMVSGKVRVDNSLKAKIEANRVELKEEPKVVDYTNMPVGQFSFTEDRVKPLVCLASEGSPVKCPPTTAAVSTATVTYAQVQDDTIVHSAPQGFPLNVADQEGAVPSTGPSQIEGVGTGLQFPAGNPGGAGVEPLGPAVPPWRRRRLDSRNLPLRGSRKWTATRASRRNLDAKRISIIWNSDLEASPCLFLLKYKTHQ